MDKSIKVKPIKNFVKEFDDPRLIQDALKEQELAISRLRLIQQEREKMDADMDKLNVDMEEFKKYVHEKSFQMENDIDMIDECENIIREEKKKQEDYNKKIKSIGIITDTLDQIVQNAKARITNYKPYEEFISKIIAKNHRYEDVFDIIKHVEELACIRNIGPSLQITEFNEKESTNNENTKEAAPIIQYKKPKKNKIILQIDFNEARTYLDDLKKADLMYIKRKEKAKSDYSTKISLNPINQIYLKTDLDKLKDKQRFAQMENLKNGIQERENENNFVISSILHQYREFYLKNEGKLPTKFPLAEEQLAYVFDYYKKLVKRLEIYENLNSGKKTLKDYISETKN